MITENLILTPHRKLFEKVVQFFLSSETDPKYFDEIKKSLIPFKRSAREKFILDNNYLTAKDFIHCPLNDLYVKESGGVPIYALRLILDCLAKNFVLSKNSILENHSEDIFSPLKSLSKFLHDQGLIENIVFGFPYIIEKYENSVFKILIQQPASDNPIEYDDAIGTGYLINYHGVLFIVTNRHVVEKAKSITIKTNDEKETIEFNELYICDESDIAVFTINQKIEIRPMPLSDDVPVPLTEVITMGYPSIPLIEKSILCCHSGEINAAAKNYINKSDLLMISSRSAPGSSGSPVLDRSGRVVGMVTEELFDESKFQSKGVLPFYAAIPKKYIDKFLLKVIAKHPSLKKMEIA